MKKILALFLTVNAVLMLTSCDKESDGVSSITTYISLEVEGDQAMTIPVGGTFTDPGAVAYMGEQNVSDKIKVSGSVNSSKPGVYTITYSATNNDGFLSSTRRYVGVVSPDAQTMNIAGKYTRPLNGAVVTIAATKYQGLYINNNPVGIVGLTNLYVYMFQVLPGEVACPPQDSNVGEFSCTDGKYLAAESTYSWKCINPGYNTSIRTFVKQ